MIAFTHVTYSGQPTNQHSSGKKLKDIADVVIDSCSLVGIAAASTEGFDMKAGATPTMPAAF